MEKIQFGGLFKIKKEFKTSISKNTVNNVLYEKFGKPYKGVNSILLREDYFT